MGKQKIVIKVSMNNQKSRSKAMKIAVGVSGVEGAAIKEDNQMEVTGEMIDSVKLTILLRKKFCHAELVSVGSVEKKEEKKEEGIVQWPYYVPNVPYNHYPVYMYKYEDPYCSIM